MNYDVTLLKWSALMMVGGGILFWIGAFIPPYRQWMTSDTKEYLTIIHGNKINWFLIHSPMVAGIVLTALSLLVFNSATQFSSNGKLFSIVGSHAYLLAAVFVIINFAFRLTVTVWASDRLSVTSQIEPWFQTWFQWSNLLFAFYMLVAYLSTVLIGLSLADVSAAPNWLTWFMVLFGAAGTLGYCAGFVFFQPPLMVHLPFIVTGIVLLFKMKGVSA